MRTCILFFSRTGNTKRMAEVISYSTKAPAFDIASSEPSVVENFDVLILGTPVTGFNPAPEVLAFIKRMPKADGKKTILFCTYALAKGSTLKVLAGELAKKGYTTVLSVSKRGLKLGKADFPEIQDKIAKTIDELPNPKEKQLCSVGENSGKAAKCIREPP